MKKATFSLIYFSIALMVLGCSAAKMLYYEDGALIQTKWDLHYVHPEFGERNFEIVFLEEGRLLNFHPNESTPDNDQWQKSGNTITLYFNDRYATYTGKLIDQKTIKGKARSITGAEWEWTATRSK